MSELVSVRLLARAIYGRSQNLVRRVAVFSAYLDGSGSVSDPSSTVFTIAGYLATDEQWQAFEADWQDVLNQFEVSSGVVPSAVEIERRLD